MNWLLFLPVLIFSTSIRSADQGGQEQEQSSLYSLFFQNLGDENFDLYINYYLQLDRSRNNGRRLFLFTHPDRNHGEKELATYFFKLAREPGQDLIINPKIINEQFKGKFQQIFKDLLNLPLDINKTREEQIQTFNHQLTKIVKYANTIKPDQNDGTEKSLLLHQTSLNLPTDRLLHNVDNIEYLHKLEECAVQIIYVYPEQKENIKAFIHQHQNQAVFAHTVLKQYQTLLNFSSEQKKLSSSIARYATFFFKKRNNQNKPIDFAHWSSTIEAYKIQLNNAADYLLTEKDAQRIGIATIYRLFELDDADTILHENEQTFTQIASSVTNWLEHYELYANHGMTLPQYLTITQKLYTDINTFLFTYRQSVARGSTKAMLLDNLKSNLTTFVSTYMQISSAGKVDHTKLTEYLKETIELGINPTAIISLDSTKIQEWIQSNVTFGEFVTYAKKYTQKYASIITANPSYKEPNLIKTALLLEREEPDLDLTELFNNKSVPDKTTFLSHYQNIQWYYSISEYMQEILNICPLFEQLTQHQSEKQELASILIAKRLDTQLDILKGRFTKKNSLKYEAVINTSINYVANQTVLEIPGASEEEQNDLKNQFDRNRIFFLKLIMQHAFIHQGLLNEDYKINPFPHKLKKNFAKLLTNSIHEIITPEVLNTRPLNLEFESNWLSTLATAQTFNIKLNCTDKQKASNPLLEAFQKYMVHAYLYRNILVKKPISSYQEWLNELNTLTPNMRQQLNTQNHGPVLGLAAPNQPQANVSNHAEADRPAPLYDKNMHKPLMRLFDLPFDRYNNIEEIEKALQEKLSKSYKHAALVWTSRCLSLAEFSSIILTSLVKHLAPVYLGQNIFNQQIHAKCEEEIKYKIQKKRIKPHQAARVLHNMKAGNYAFSDQYNLKRSILLLAGQNSPHLHHFYQFI